MCVRSTCSSRSIVSKALLQFREYRFMQPHSKKWLSDTVINYHQAASFPLESAHKGKKAAIWGEGSERGARCLKQRMHAYFTPLEIAFVVVIDDSLSLPHFLPSSSDTQNRGMSGFSTTCVLQRCVVSRWERASTSFLGAFLFCH